MRLKVPVEYELQRLKAIDFLRHYAPNYCWMTGFELFLMYEQINEDADYHCFKVILCKAQNNEDIFHVKKVKFPVALSKQKNSVLYLRKDTPYDRKAPIKSSSNI